MSATSGGEVGRYDVEAMIRDALIHARHEWEVEVRAVRDELYETHRYLQGEIDSLERVLNARTADRV